jgi:hypothetical protein
MEVNPEKQNINTLFSVTNYHIDFRRSITTKATDRLRFDRELYTRHHTTELESVAAAVRH